MRPGRIGPRNGIRMYRAVIGLEGTQKARRRLISGPGYCRRTNWGGHRAFFRKMRIKRNPRGIRALLIGLCGALAVAAAIAFAVQWNEGQAAARNAGVLLNASGITPPAALSGGSGAEARATAGQNPDETEGAFPSALQGYAVTARLDIAVLDLHLPVLSQSTEEALKVSVCCYAGPDPGGEGNLVVTGHNYRSGAHFGRLDQLKKGDAVLVTGTNGKTCPYVVYKLEHIKPDDVEALQNTEYDRELALLTCEDSGNGRLLVRCKMVEDQG
jgi:LPXTG-site transpeptidase (sortase) family protein